MKMKKTRWPLFVVATLLVAMLTLPAVASADHAWGSYHWARTASPLPLSLGDNVSGAWDVHLAAANSDWNLSPVLDNTVDAGRTNPRKCSPGSGLVEICNAQYGFNGWLGIAGIWASGDHITKGYVKVNDSYFDTSTYNTPEWRQLVMCQEVGHVFGLGHQDENFNNLNLDTCMDYSSSPGSNQNPNQHDYDMLASMYAHLDAFDSYSAAPIDGGSGEGNGNGRGKKGEAPGLVMSEWGKAISTDGKGRPDLFEVDLGNGNKVLTHVFWAN
ncbi:MAG: hypothetical protein BZY79_01125 [SAR202 cluster bacterium Casp-Chloro-G4]|nr:hypothetical protein [Chloroflexota bacterium]MDA1226932.1 hypothetical protein [Chloroflexota bacterium]PKB61962.1 MAG: hypothetical protein BZY79_01125 [SAR202 cluster bacterium Casp-Chloro-G4]